MLLYINFNIKVVSDHHAKIIQLSKVILMHNTVSPFIQKINILEICWVSKEILIHNSNTIISHYICHSIVKILYIEKIVLVLVLNRTGTEELRCTTLCTTTMHIEMYVCMYVLYCLLL